ncbi:class I adenylate-forming enzyme family protein [Effusibacillus pohliae]|uniref:class I adenylate-forming enzyme family protein n=1 Tax=Effusibacillus pohliae TaxID=232270 RepID=UPI0003806024|nr:class I adenylate-forming enzyme family protein [Effusibacillus pohliae]
MEQRFEQVVRFGRQLHVYENRPRSLYQLLAQSADRQPERIALIYEEQRISYGELLGRVNRVAEHLVHFWQLKKGDRIGIVLPNLPEFCELLLAAAKAGVIAVLLNTRLAAEELRFMVEHSGCRIVFYHKDFEEKIGRLRERFPQVRFVAIGDPTGGSSQSYEQVVVRELPITVEDSADETAPCYIMYTSGTTGTPKGAIACHLNIIHSAINYREVCGTSHEDRTIVAVPLFHVTGLIGQLVHMLLAGGTSVLVREYSTGHFLQTSIAHQVTFMFNVPAIYKLLLLQEELLQLTSLRLALYGGAPMSPDTILQLREIFPRLDLRNAYGATETSSPTTLMPAGWEMEKVRSVGIPVPGADCRVIGDDGRECGPGEVGELWIAGPMVIPGYWENDAANRHSFAEGYWKSGDMAMIDEDGYVYIMDRKRDIINRGGEKIYSVEVENVLCSHPNILEAAVVGVPDEIFGEQVKAFVVLKQPGAVTPHEIQQFVKQHLADYKVPEYVEFIDSLPRNPGGKVLKQALREKGRSS